MSVIVPSHNEEQSLAATVQNILDFCPNDFDMELILVNDASSDDTAIVMERIHSEYPKQVKIVSHEIQGGLGATLRTGFALAQGDILTWIPGDGEFSFHDIATGMSKLENADIVLFTRTSRGQIHRGLISAFMHLFIRSLLRADLKNYSGLFLLNSQNWQRVKPDSVSTLYAIEVALSAMKNELVVTWAQASWLPRAAGKSSVFRPVVLLSSFWDLLSMVTRTTIRKSTG